MTVSYSFDVSKITPVTPLKLLTKWKGSVFKVLFVETLVYFICYLSLALSYRFAMSPEYQRIFEKIVAYCENFSSMIPVTFILGFYVSVVFTRWSNMLNHLAWPDKVALLLATNLNSPGGGNDAKCRLYRRTIIRYMVLAQVLTLRNVSMQVKKRFPTIDHVLEAGLIEKDELALMNDLETVPGDTKFWLVIEWSMAILNRARAEQKIASDYLMQAICEKLDEYRGLLGGMLMNDWINVPLIYTQIVTIAVWTYFLAGLLDLYVPVFSIIQFICLLGWLRVAQSMLNPLGEADDDFELNYIIDRNLKVGMVMVDDACRKTPFLKLDAFYDDDNAELPHTEASLPTSHQVIKNSCADVEIEETAARIVPSINSSHASSVRNRGGSRLSLVSKIQPSIQRIVSRKASNHSGIGGGDLLTTVIEDGGAGWNSINSTHFTNKNSGHTNVINPGFGDHQPDELDLLHNGGGSKETDLKINKETVHHQKLNDLQDVDGPDTKTDNPSLTSSIDNDSDGWEGDGTRSPGFGRARKLSTVTEEPSDSSTIPANRNIPVKPSPKNSTDSGNFTSDSNASSLLRIRTGSKLSESDVNDDETGFRVVMNNQRKPSGAYFETNSNNDLVNGIFCDTKDETIAKIM